MVRAAKARCSHSTWGPTTERIDSRRPGRGTEAPPIFKAGERNADALSLGRNWL